MDSDKLAAIVDHAAQAALERAPPSLDLGDLADNGAFHVLIGLRLRSRARLAPLSHDFFREILFDAPLSAAEASRGVAGYLLVKAEDFRRPKNPNAPQPSNAGEAAKSLPLSRRLLAAAAACAGLIAFLWLNGIKPSVEGSLALFWIASLFACLWGQVARAGHEWGLGVQIGSASRTLAPSAAMRLGEHWESRGSIEGLAHLVLASLALLLAHGANLSVSYFYLGFGSSEWGLAWGWGTFGAILALFWSLSVSGMADKRRFLLETDLERWRKIRRDNDSPPLSGH